MTNLYYILYRRHWNNLDANQSKYLVQVMPPSDIISQLVALASSLQNMTNAAILHDDSFGLPRKYNLMSTQ